MKKLKKIQNLGISQDKEILINIIKHDRSPTKKRNHNRNRLKRISLQNERAYKTGPANFKIFKSYKTQNSVQSSFSNRTFDAKDFLQGKFCKKKIFGLNRSVDTRLNHRDTILSLRSNSVENDFRFRTDGFKLQKEMKWINDNDPQKLFIESTENEFGDIKFSTPKKKKEKNDMSDYQNNYIIDKIKIDKEVPKCVSFSRRLMVLLEVDCKGKYFPCFVKVDRVGAVFDFLITFDGRVPSQTESDLKFSGDNFIIKRDPFGSGGRKMLILVRRTEKMRVMLSVSFTSKKINKI